MSKHDAEYIDKFQPVVGRKEEQDEAHHELGPSALKYVEICPGYRSEKNVSTPWAEEGTMLHEACENDDMEGLDEEQASAVATCLDYVNKLEKDADKVYKEHKVYISLEPVEEGIARGSQPTDERESFE